MNITKLLALSVLLGISPSAPAQKALIGTEIGKIESYSFQSVARPNLGPYAIAVAEKLVHRKGAGWLQIEFGECVLPKDSWLELYSPLDHEIEILDAERLAQQNRLSLYFNGDAVRVRLFAGAGSKSASFSIRSLGVGRSRAELLPLSLCGTDSRYRVSDKRIARLIVRRGTGYTWCTAFLISSTNCFATSGSCMAMPGTTSLVAEFWVPSSTSTGAIVHPSTINQYVWMGSSSSVAAWQSSGVGNDWGVFKTLANSSTKKHAGAAQGGYVLFQATPAAKTSARLTGYGMDNTPLTYSGTEQSSLGTQHSASGYRINFAVDTTTGCSGAPVEASYTAKAYGIATHEYCSSFGGYNSGTSAAHPSFAAARKRLCGGGNSKPDYAPTFIYISSKTPSANQVVSVQSFLMNVSTVSAPSSTAGYYLSTNSVITNTDLLVGSFTAPALGAYVSHKDSRSLRMPSNIPSGTCWFAILADHLGRVAETRETNNSMSLIVTCKGAPKPDLQVYSYSVAGTQTSGGTMRITTSTINRAPGTASASYTGIFLSRDSTITKADYFIGAHYTGVLGFNKIQSVTTTQSVPVAVSPGTWYIGIVADYDGRVQETVETNNTRASLLRIVEMSTAKKRVEFQPVLGTMATTETYASGSARTGGVARLCVAAPAYRGHYALLVWSRNSRWVADDLTTFSLLLMNGGVFQNWFTRLDNTGRAYPTFNLPRVTGIRSFSAYTKAMFLSASNFTLLGSSDNVIRTVIQP